MPNQSTLRFCCHVVFILVFSPVLHVWMDEGEVVSVCLGVDLSHGVHWFQRQPLRSCVHCWKTESWLYLVQ